MFLNEQKSFEIGPGSLYYQKYITHYVYNTSDIII